MPNIRDTFGLSMVKEYKGASDYRVRRKMETPNNALFGVELEIENLSEEHSLGYYIVPGFSYTEDGSLRGICAEFITKPVRADVLEPMLERFYKQGKFNESNFTERCSTHVHMNVQELTIEQVNALLVLYQVFERTLFHFVGDERDRNIFCVPWYDTSITANSVFSSPNPGVCLQMWKKWEKYTALNLKRMADLGTIEFRHLAGQPDYKKIVLWCDILACMYEYILVKDYKTIFDRVLRMNTSSEYRRFFVEVFGPCPEFMNKSLYFTMLENDMMEGIMTFKYSVMEEQKGHYRGNVPRVEKSKSIVQQGLELGLSGPALIQWLQQQPPADLTTGIDYYYSPSTVQTSTFEAWLNNTEPSEGSF